MNDKTRAKFLKLRQRADELELELIEARKAQATAVADLERARRGIEGGKARATDDAMIARQQTARRETTIARLCQALDRFAPWPSPGHWRTIAESEALWSDQQLQWMINGTSAEIKLHTVPPTEVAGWGIFTSAAGGTGGVAYGVDPMAPARSWVSGSAGAGGGSGGRVVRTEAERSAEPWPGEQ